MESLDFNNLCLKKQTKRILKRKTGMENWKDIFKRSVSQARKNMMKTRRMSNGEQLIKEANERKSKSKKRTNLHRKSYSIQSRTHEIGAKTWQNFKSRGSPGSGSGSGGANSPSKLYFKGGKRTFGKSVRQCVINKSKTIRPSFTVKVDLSTYVSPQPPS